MRCRPDAVDPRRRGRQTAATRRRRPRAGRRPRVGRRACRSAGRAPSRFGAAEETSDQGAGGGEFVDDPGRDRSPRKGSIRPAAERTIDDAVRGRPRRRSRPLTTSRMERSALEAAGPDRLAGRSVQTIEVAIGRTEIDAAVADGRFGADRSFGGEFPHLSGRFDRSPVSPLRRPWKPGPQIPEAKTCRSPPSR